jgi:hypothetical protein
MTKPIVNLRRPSTHRRATHYEHTEHDQVSQQRSWDTARSGNRGVAFGQHEYHVLALSGYPHPFLRPHHLCPRPRLPRPFHLVTVILVSTCPHHFLHRPRRPLSLLSACLAMALAVPQMPESTLDGTLETRQKKVADTESKDCHHRDRRLTYFVCAPAAGRITEWLANEEKYRSSCDLCIPGVKRTVLVEDEATARVCRSRDRAVVQILYADAWCPFTRACYIYGTTIHHRNEAVGSSLEPWISQSI